MASVALSQDSTERDSLYLLHHSWTCQKKKKSRWKKAALNIKPAWTAPESQSWSDLHACVQLTKIHQAGIVRSTGDILRQGNPLVLVPVQAPLVLNLSVPKARLKQSLETEDVCGIPLRASEAVLRLDCGFRLEIRKRLSSSRTC